MTKLTRLRMLKIVREPKTKCWYSGMSGQYVPLCGFDAPLWRTRQADGVINFIAEEDALTVSVFVQDWQLSQYPYNLVPVAYINTPPAPPKCKDRCDMLGVCRGLPDCEEAMGRARMVDLKSPHLKAPLGPAADRRFFVALGQSHRASVIEAATNIVLGFGISVGITAVLMPALGHHVTLSENLAITSVFTVASFARAYGLRRLFNWLHCKRRAS